MAGVSIARRWTPDEEALLNQLLKQGKSSTAIAARLERSVGSIERKAYDLRARSAFRAEQAKSER